MNQAQTPKKCVTPPFPTLITTGSILAIPFTTYIQSGHPRTIWQFGKDAANRLLYVRQGELFVRTEHASFHLLRSDCLMLPANCAFDIISKESHSTDVSMTSFHLWAALDADTKAALSVPFLRQGAVFLEEALLKLEYYTRVGKGNLACANALLFLILEDLLHYKNTTPTSSYLFDTVSDYVRRHIRNIQTAETLSSALHYPRSRLADAVKRETGMTVSRFIAEEKLAAIKRYLLTTSYHDEEIATFFYFASTKAFISFFTYHENISPSQYRRQHGNMCNDI